MKSFFLLVLSCLCQLTMAQRTLIHCGTLIDGKSKETATLVTIVVDGNKIVSVDKGLTKPGKDDKLIDLSKKTVIYTPVMLRCFDSGQ